LEDCIFCKIIGRKTPSTIVYEDEDSVAFLDIYPINPAHTLVVPKKHYPTMLEMPPSEVGQLFVVVAKVARAVGKASKADGISIGQSNGAAASQDVFHMHVHVIPRFHGDSPSGLAFPKRKRMTQDEREKWGVLIRKTMTE
jgi:histidine triad (HIT) family protein